MQIGNTIANINTEIINNPSRNPLYNLMQIKNQKLYETFLKLKPFTRRHKRWDTIGTVWKWIAGNPDAEDLRIINSTFNSLISQNNKQVMINEAISKRINEVTYITNQILKKEKERSKNYSLEINQLIILSNLDSLQDQIETLEEAILMSKHGIPSSKLLSMKDFNTIAAFLGRHDVHVNSFEELLSQSAAQVTLNDTHVIYMLKVPQLSKTEYEYDYIDSIIKNNQRILINQNFIIKNSTNVYQLNEPCEEQNNYHLCEETQLNIANECITKLIKGQHSNCIFEKVYFNGIIKPINKGTVLINSATIELSSNCSNSNQLLNGSFIIQFEKCSIRINGELYENIDFEIPGRPYLPTTGLIANSDFVIDEPPEEYLQNLTLEHRDTLKTLTLQNNSLTWKLHLFGSFGLTIPIVIILVTCVYCYLSRRQKTDIIVAYNATEEKVKIMDQEQEQPEQLNEKKEPAQTFVELPVESSPEISEQREKGIQSFLNTPTPFRTIL